MEIVSNNISQQNFKALKFTNVCTFDRENFIKKSFKELKKLGEQYDIRLTSCYSARPEYGLIDIDVRPLKAGLSFFQRLCRPVGFSSFVIETSENILKSKEDFLNAVHEAIADLKEKVNLHK